MKVFSLYKNEEDLKDMHETIKSRRDKDFRIEPDGFTGFYVIVWAGEGGVFPNCLKGKYTSMAQARRAVLKYVAQQKPNHVTRQREQEELVRRRQAEFHASMEAKRLAKEKKLAEQDKK